MLGTPTLPIPLPHPAHHNHSPKTLFPYPAPTLATIAPFPRDAASSAMFKNNRR
jgi:hypothetical protein